MSKLKLPTNPTGVEFEELVAAIFQSSGHFLDRRVILRDSHDILELDIMCQPFSDPPSESFLVEAKSGKYGYSDVFKLAGWMKYLNLSRGALVAAKKTEKADGLRHVATSLGISIHEAVLPKAPVKAIQDLLGGNEPTHHQTKFWRYFFWLERNMNWLLDEWAKSHPDKFGFNAMKQYRHGITSGAFFEPHHLLKVRSLYRLYKDMPNLTLRVGDEHGGGAFDSQEPRIESNLFKRTFYEGALNPIQVAAHLEYQGRLGILKAAVEHAIGTPAHSPLHLDATKTAEGSLIDDVLYPQLPRSFRDGFEQVRNDTFLRRYPVLWQWILGPLGGLILVDREPEERAWLSAVSGVPDDALDRALETFDLVFPIAGGWWSTSKFSNMKLLKEFPAPVRGVGCIERVLRYTESRDINDLGLTGTYTLVNVKKYVGKCIEVLNKAT